jgi:hypothetical protein
VLLRQEGDGDAARQPTVVRLPYITLLTPRLKLKFTAITLWFVILFKKPVSQWCIDHEYRHVEQWTALNALGAAIIVSLKVTLGVSLWFLLLAPFTFPVVYLTLLIFFEHAGHPFEIDADNYANRVAGTNYHQHR